MELRAEAGARFAFLPPEEAPGALFDLGDGKASEADDAFRELGAHDDLFESISDAHYLPELGGHDEALLESLVEKGCEDNQILGRLDRLTAQLATGGEYEEDALLDGAPVADIIGRLESLESPSRSAAQGLLHLRHLPARRPSAVDPFVPDEVFAPEPCEPAPAPPATSDPERRLRSDGGPAEVMYTEQVPELPDAFDYEGYEDLARPSEGMLVQTDVTSSEEAPRLSTEQTDAMEPRSESDENDLGDLKLDILASEMEGIEFKLDVSELADLKKEEPREEVEKATDLSAVLEIDAEDVTAPTTKMPTALESLAFHESEQSDKSEDLPKDLSMHRRLSSSYASPRRIDIPRAPSRESDAMQSPQPSGIPAISSPEVFNTPTTKCKQPSFLESLYASTSPKMYTSEVTIQQCVPLNLGKHRKSASPTVSSCSDELRNVNKDSGEPQEKRVRRESHDLAKICNLLKKCGENKLAEAKQKKKLSEIEQLPPLKQLELLKSNKNFNLPDHMLVPRDRINKIIAAPGKEIPALLMERPQLNMPEILQDPNCTGDPELMVLSLEQIRQLIIHNVKTQTDKCKRSESDNSKENTKEHDKESASMKSSSKNSDHNKPSSSERTPTPTNGTPQPPSDQTGAAAQPRPIPSMGHLADDIDAANSAAAYQMSWLPAYLNHLSQVSQLEAVAACSQNAEFLKALSSSGSYAGSNYANLSQMFHPSRFMNLPNFPMMPPMDYESRMQLAMWQEAVNASAAQAQRHKHAASVERQTADALLKEVSAPSDYPSPYAHFAKSQQQPAGKHSAARTSPIAGNYTNNQRAHAHNHFMQSMYPGINPAMRPTGTAPPNIQIPYYNPAGSQRSPRTAQTKSPTSPYYPNNNYLQSAKQAEHSRGQGSPRPRISVKSLQELQHTALAASMSAHVRRTAPPTPSRRREEPEVGSTTSAGEPPLMPPHMPMPPHPHDPAAFPIWHPLFSK